MRASSPDPCTLSGGHRGPGQVSGPRSDTHAPAARGGGSAGPARPRAREDQIIVRSTGSSLSASSSIESPVAVADSPLLSRSMMGAARREGPGRTSERSSEEANVSHAVCRARDPRACMHVCLRGSNQAVIIRLALHGRAGVRPEPGLPPATASHRRYTARACRSHEVTNEWRLRVRAPGSPCTYFSHLPAVDLLACRCSSRFFLPLSASFFRHARDGCLPTGSRSCYRGGGILYSCSPSDLASRHRPDCVTALFSMLLSFVRG